MNLFCAIDKLAQQGFVQAKRGNYPQALDLYWKAFDLIPEPKTNWEATTLVLTAIGDANFHTHDFKAGMDNLKNALHCPNAVGNPLFHLRLGQCQFELGNLDRATDELTRAYSLRGEKIFQSDDPKYLNFILKKIQKPEKNKWWRFN